jgi:hypothetical protein
MVSEHPAIDTDGGYNWLEVIDWLKTPAAFMLLSLKEEVWYIEPI